MPQKVVFAGTASFAMPSLEALIAHDNVCVIAVFTQPDRPAGRGKKLTWSPVKARAVELDIPVYQLDHLDSPDTVAMLDSFAPDLLVVAAYGIILPPDILAIPRRGCVNVHGSLLPRWRGAAPVQRAIEAGDRVTGISLMQMDAGLDSGPVHVQRRLEISPCDTGGTLDAKLAEVGGTVLFDHLDRILDGTLPAVKQHPKGIIYASKLSRQESQIHWDRSAAVIARRIRAFNPWPVTKTLFRGEQLRLLMASEVPDRGVKQLPGEVLSVHREGIEIACSVGAVRVTRLQKPGGRELGARDFCNGTGLAVGEQLG